MYHIKQVYIISTIIFWLSKSASIAKPFVKNNKCLKFGNKMCNAMKKMCSVISTFFRYITSSYIYTGSLNILIFNCISFSEMKVKKIPYIMLECL